MKTENLSRYLTSFGKYIVKQSRTILSKKKKNVNKALYNSIRFQIKADAQGFEIDFFMLDYGKFVDKGVQGWEEKDNKYTNYKGEEKLTTYSFKRNTPLVPIGDLMSWIKARGIKARDKKGRFSATTRKGLAFAISHSIKRRGMKGISFFQRPMELGLNRYGGELLSELSKDIQAEIKLVAKDLTIENN